MSEIVLLIWFLNWYYILIWRWEFVKRKLLSSFESHGLHRSSSFHYPLINHFFHKCLTSSIFIITYFIKYNRCCCFCCCCCYKCVKKYCTFHHSIIAYYYRNFFPNVKMSTSLFFLCKSFFLYDMPYFNFVFVLWRSIKCPQFTTNVIF